MTVDDPLRRSQSALQLREVEPMAELSPLTAAGVKGRRRQRLEGWQSG